MDYYYKISTPEVVDGDTVRVVVDLGFRVQYVTNVRLAGVNAPELRTVEGKRVRDLLSQLVEHNALGQWHARTYKDGRDKYGRWLADVYTPTSADGLRLSLGEWLLGEGLAVPYRGG